MKGADFLFARDHFNSILIKCLPNWGLVYFVLVSM